MLTDKELENSLLAKEAILTSKVQKMFEMQNELNKIINPTWYSKELKESGWDFQRATMIELGELMDHYGYKWWKHTVPDIEQCKLEVVDITHFYISYLIQKSMEEMEDPYFYVKGFATGLVDLNMANKSAGNIRALIDFCIGQAATKTFTIDDLNYLLNAFEMDPHELCNTYIIKNTLNIFRARNGYKAGTYIKIWNGREDNEVLMEVSKLLDSNSATYAEDLYSKLTEEYSKYN